MRDNEKPTNDKGAGKNAHSRRAFAILFFAGAAVLATACWLRPPLSTDLRSYHLGLWNSASVSPEEILAGPRQIPLDSAGIAVMMLILAGLAMTLWRPGRLGLAAGVLLCAAVAANAAVAFNHPALIEMMDYEYEQRRQIANVNAQSPQGLPMTAMSTPMAKAQNGRVGLRGAPTGDEQRADLVRGWGYLHYGMWLIPWAAAGVLLSVGGPLTERAAKLALCCFAALIVTGLVCSRRFTAEYYWQQALTLESRADGVAARNALQSAVALMPDFAHLERTWLLTGKLDFHANLSTPERQFFCAYQLSRNRTRPRAVALAQDFPWVIARVQDYREGLENLPTGIEMTMGPGETETGTRDLRKGYHRRDDPIDPASLVYGNYSNVVALEARQALHIMDDLLAEEVGVQPAVRHQASRLWTNVGLGRYQQDARLTDAGMVYHDQNRWITSAHQAWGRAVQIDPDNRYGQFFVGMAQARAGRMIPAKAEATFAPVLKGTADKALRADILNALGDAYFEAGLIDDARRCYIASFDVFNFPSFDNINYRAARKLGGL